MSKDNGLDTSKVTRFEVIDWTLPEGESSRCLVKYGVRVTAMLQDDDRTLKIFIEKEIDCVRDDL